MSDNRQIRRDCQTTPGVNNASRNFLEGISQHSRELHPKIERAFLRIYTAPSRSGQYVTKFIHLQHPPSASGKEESLRQNSVRANPRKKVRATRTQARPVLSRADCQSLDIF